MPKGGFITGGVGRGDPEDFHPIDAVTVEDFSGGSHDLAGFVDGERQHLRSARGGGSE